MKKITLMLALCLAFVSSAHASGSKEEANQENFSLESFIDFGNDVDVYTGELGHRLISHAGATVTHKPTEVYISSVAYLTDTVEEIDISVGKTISILDDQVLLDAGVGYYGIKDFEDFAAIYLGITLPSVYGITPSLYVESDYGISGERGGLFWKVGAKKSITMYDKEFIMDFESGGNDGLYGTEAKIVSFVRVGISSSYDFTNISITPSVSIQKGSDADAIAGDETVGIFTISVNF